MILGEFEKMVYEQMIVEYPGMEKKGKTFNSSGRGFESVEQVTYYVTNKMWDTFDSALDDIEDKGE